MHEFTTHYKFESHGRRQSFDFFGKSRDELYRSVPVVAARVPTPPPATPPPSSPQPSEEEEEETISLPGQASLPAIVAKGTRLRHPPSSHFGFMSIDRTAYIFDIIVFYYLYLFI